MSITVRFWVTWYGQFGVQQVCWFRRTGWIQ